MNAINAILSFLTIIPTKSYDLKEIAENLYLFPIAGLIIGLVGVIAFLPLHSLIEGFLIIVALMIITGGHHTDALADFADGLMVKGDKERKKKVMHDPITGSIGVSAIGIYLIGSVIALSFLDNMELFLAVIISEILAKYSMVLLAYLGKPAWEGMGSLFRINKKMFIISTVMTIVIIYLLADIDAIYPIILTIILTIIILLVSSKAFGGISGDIFGANNEIVRLGNYILFAHLTITPFLVNLL